MPDTPTCSATPSTSRTSPASPPGDRPTVPASTKPVTPESTLNQSCQHLLTALGLGIIYRERVADFAGLPAPQITFHL
ncbi:hypothetical protein [Streptacidiphilus sp. EB129]|uniref:hypothetical protein n=1 Tax=Streptacidiphilus sp. EB129 TaxID=3156262 RepID=UPI003516F7BF